MRRGLSIARHHGGRTVKSEPVADHAVHAPEVPSDGVINAAGGVMGDGAFGLVERPFCDRLAGLTEGPWRKQNKHEDGRYCWEGNSLHCDRASRKTRYLTPHLMDEPIAGESTHGGNPVMQNISVRDNQGKVRTTTVIGSKILP